jgi:UPF0042 nucleotide-binding protein
MTHKTGPLQIVIVSGMSGAGKSSAASILEDLGYFAVDNLPAELTDTLTAFFERDPELQRVALVLDSREAEFPSTVLHAMQVCKARGHQVRLLLFTADREELLKRYAETRRRHPLVKKDSPLISLAIDKEATLCNQLRDKADLVIDSTHMNVHDLRFAIQEFLGAVDETFNLNVLSFGFKHGLPGDASYVFDLRFLPNPYFQPALSRMNGCDAPVRDWLFARPEYARTMETLLPFLELAVPSNRQEGKPVLTVAFGCTGGRHRSVVAAEQVAAHFQRLLGEAQVRLIHRDLDRE